MHIVILDGGSTNPGDVSWAPLRALGSVTVYDSTKPEEIVERAKDAEAVILNRNVISREIMRNCRSCALSAFLQRGIILSMSKPQENWASPCVMCRFIAWRPSRSRRLRCFWSCAITPKK